MTVAGCFPLTPQQIILMNFGFFGTQYSFGMRQTAINPIFILLARGCRQPAAAQHGGPITGLIVQPIVEVMSDRTWSPRWGRGWARSALPSATGR